MYRIAIKKNEILLFSGKWMKLESVMLREINQIEKDKYYEWNPVLKNE
jgi:hypothetical protein